METKDRSPQQLFVSHTMRPDVTEYRAYGVQKVYHDIYTEMKAGVKNDALWERVITLAEQEHQQGIEMSLPSVPLEEMITVGRLVAHAKTQSERYHHLFERSSNGKMWYDIILGENANVISSVIPLLRQVIERRGRKFDQALDIGTGTGNAVQKIAPFCSSVVGIDILPEAIAIARARTDIVGRREFQVGDATNLQFPDASMDLVLSNGVTLYMRKQEEKKQNDEIHRVLHPDGMYVMTNGVSDDLHTRDIHGAKELLGELIGNTIKDSAPPHAEQMTLGDARRQFLDKGYQEIRPLVKDKNWIVGLIKPRI